MMKDEHFWELQRTLSAEFSKYVLSHPETDNKIPDNAQIVFHIKGQDDFNKWSEDFTDDADKHRLKQKGIYLRKSA